MIGPSITWPRGAGGLVVYNDMFYLLGGNNAGHDGGFVPWFDRYDPRTGEWRLLRDAPHARDHFHSVVIDNKLYAAGGRRTIRGNTLGDTVKEVDVYDLESGEWLAEDALPRDLPLPRASAAAAAFDGKLLLMGGETRENPVAFDRVDSLDPETGRWSTLTPMNYKRHGMQAIVSGDGIFVAAGSPRRGGGQQRNMEVYNENAPVGVPSSGGTLGLLFGGASSVTIQHMGGNQGVFVNSIDVEGPSAADFVIKNRTTSRFLIPKEGSFEIHFEYQGTPGQQASAAGCSDVHCQQEASHQPVCNKMIKFSNNIYIIILEHRNSRRLSRTSSTVEPIALAKSSWSGRGRSVYCITKSPSITDFFRSLFLQPPRRGVRRYSLQARWLNEQSLSRALAITL